MTRAKVPLEERERRVLADARVSRLTRDSPDGIQVETLGLLMAAYQSERQRSAQQSDRGLDKSGTVEGSLHGSDLDRRHDPKYNHDPPPSTGAIAFYREEGGLSAPTNLQ